MIDLIWFVLGMGTGVLAGLMYSAAGDEYDTEVVSADDNRYKINVAKDNEIENAVAEYVEEQFVDSMLGVRRRDTFVVERVDMTAGGDWDVYFKLVSPTGDSA